MQNQILINSQEYQFQEMQNGVIMEPTQKSTEELPGI